MQLHDAFGIGGCETRDDRQRLRRRRIVGEFRNADDRRARADGEQIFGQRRNQRDDAMRRIDMRGCGGRARGEREHRGERKNADGGHTSAIRRAGHQACVEQLRPYSREREAGLNPARSRHCMRGAAGTSLRFVGGRHRPEGTDPQVRIPSPRVITALPPREKVGIGHVLTRTHACAFCAVCRRRCRHLRHARAGACPKRPGARGIGISATRNRTRRHQRPSRRAARRDVAADLHRDQGTHAAARRRRRRIGDRGRPRRPHPALRRRRRTGGCQHPRRPRRRHPRAHGRPAHFGQ